MNFSQLRNWLTLAYCVCGFGQWPVCGMAMILNGSAVADWPIFDDRFGVQLVLAVDSMPCNATLCELMVCRWCNVVHFWWFSHAFLAYGVCFMR